MYDDSDDDGFNINIVECKLIHSTFVNTSVIVLI